MAVYMIRAGETERVKIGYATDVSQRMRELQSGCWERLRLLRQMAGDKFTEGWLHRYFASFHIDRDWFVFDEEMLTVRAPDLTYLRPTVSSDGVFRQHSDVIAAFGGARAIAEAIGVDPKKAIHWHRRGIPARYWLPVERAAAQRGILVTGWDLLELSDEGADATDTARLAAE